MLTLLLVHLLTKLLMYIEGLTRFSFKYIDAADWERRFSILIDISTNRFRVQSCEPMIPQLSTLLEELNVGGDFFAFLRKVRAAFVDSRK